MDLDGLHVGIVAQRGNDGAHSFAGELLAHLADWGVAATVDSATGSVIDHRSAPVADLRDCDLLVTLGGDGTLLFAAREAVSPPLLGIDLGEVGFLSATEPERAVSVLEETLETYGETGSIPATERPRLAAVGDDWHLGPVVNDVALLGHRRGRGGGGVFSVTVDGDEYGAGHADGVLVATPTGSTAYALSEGGPIVAPGAPVVLVVGMSSTWDRPPLVLEQDRSVSIEVTGPSTAHLVGDGRDRRSLSPPSTVEIEMASEPLRLVADRRSIGAALDELE